MAWKSLKTRSFLVRTLSVFGDLSLITTIPINYEHTPLPITPGTSYTGCTVILRGAGGELGDLLLILLPAGLCSSCSLVLGQTEPSDFGGITVPQ